MKDKDRDKDAKRSKKSVGKRNILCMMICILCIFNLFGCSKETASVMNNGNPLTMTDEILGPFVYTSPMTEEALTEPADAFTTEAAAEDETETKTEEIATEPTTECVTEAITPLQPITESLTTAASVIEPATEPITEKITEAEMTAPPETAPTEVKTIRHTEVFKSTREIDKTKPMIALTFDDGPSKYTVEIVDKLVEYQSAATFFMIGAQVEKFAETVKYVADSGCEFGNHTWNHKSLAAISFEAIDYEINSTQDIIFNTAGVYPMYVRPPYGALTPEVKAYIGYPLILWSVDTNDWKYKDVERIVNYVMEKASDGEVILLHDLYQTTKDAALIFIPKLIEAGYQLVTLTELYESKGYIVEAGSTYSSVK